MAICDEGLTLSLLSCLASLLRTLSSPLPQHFLEAVPKIFGWYFYFVGGPCPCVLGVDTVESTKLTNLILILNRKKLGACWVKVLYVLMEYILKL